MRTTLILAAALVLVAGLGMAGDYHYGEELICSDCHVMHGSVTHADTGWFPGTYNSGDGFDYLLKAATETALCLTCHDGQSFAPDVLNDRTEAINRSGGALNDGSVTAYPVGRGHTLYSTATAPGGTWSEPDGLGCANCHNHHGWMGPNTGTMTDIGGNAYNATLGGYRNLEPRDKFNPVAATYVSYELTANQTADFYERDQRDYKTDMIDMQEPIATESGIAYWCGTCHGDFHGADVTAAPYSADAVTNGFEHFNKHPASTVDIGDLGGGHSSLGLFNSHDYRVRVMDPNGDWTQGTAATMTDVTPTCLSCHKAHGTTKPFGLIYFDGALDDPTTTGAENGSGTYRSLCGQCHVQAG